MIIVILKMDHTWRHDFYSSIKANEFANKFPKVSLLVSVDYRKESNMKNLERYP